MEYYLQTTWATLALELRDDRLVVSIRGKGLIDRPKTTEVPLADLKQFCVVPTIGVQNINGRRDPEGSGFRFDRSYDAEFIFSYEDQGKVKKRRVFVNQGDEAFQGLLGSLSTRCPDASLLHLEPAVARKQIGVMSPRTAVAIIVGLLVGIPVLVAAISLLVMAWNGFKE